MFPIRLTKCKLSEEGIQYSKVKAVLDLGKLQSEVERSGTELLGKIYHLHKICYTT